MTTLRDAAQQALEALETVLSDAYHRRFPECCGRPGIECCGNPNEAWTPEDNKIMDLLSPAQRQLSDALRAALAEPAEQEPVAAQHRFRHPQKGTPDWSVWQPCKINNKRPAHEIDSQGYQVEYRALYTAPQPTAVPAEDAIEAALVRAAALEEAAGVCDEQAHDWHHHAKGGPVSAYNACAAAIRQLKDKT